MESSFSFGRILTPFHPIREELPLGPHTRSDIQNVYNILGLGEYVEDMETLSILDEFDTTLHPHVLDTDDNALLMALENIETSHQNHQDSHRQDKRKNSWNIDDTDDELLSTVLENFDETSYQNHQDSPRQDKRKNSWNIDDTDDELLSMMLEDFDESHRPKREIKKFKDINLN